MTFSHTPPQLNKLYVIVADRAQARFFESDWPDVKTLREIEDLIHPAGHLRESETVTDSPGRFSTGTAHTASGQPTVDYRHQHAEIFGKQIVDSLEHARQRHAFDRLILIAPPLLLGVLRQHLTVSLAQLVVKELHKELTHARTDEILDYVREVAEEFASTNS